LWINPPFASNFSILLPEAVERYRFSSAFYSVFIFFFCLPPLTSCTFPPASVLSLGLCFDYSNAPGIPFRSCASPFAPTPPPQILDLLLYFFFLQGSKLSLTRFPLPPLSPIFPRVERPIPPPPPLPRRHLMKGFPCRFFIARLQSSSGFLCRTLFFLVPPP